MEREYKNKSAGLKTHILICLGATALTFLSIQFSFHGDPGRIAAQIISGVGFIGGGAILHSHKVVQGLTTASTLWAAASLGMLIGGGLIIPAFIFTAVCMVVLLGSTRMSNTRIIRQNYSVSLEISDPGVLPQIEKLIGKYELTVDTKVLSRQKKLFLELNYYATPLAQHLFFQRVLTLQGVGVVLTI